MPLRDQSAISNSQDWAVTGGTTDQRGLTDSAALLLDWNNLSESQ